MDVTVTVEAVSASVLIQPLAVARTFALIHQGAIRFLSNADESSLANAQKLSWAETSWQQTEAVTLSRCMLSSAWQQLRNSEPAQGTPDYDARLTRSSKPSHRSFCRTAFGMLFAALLTWV